MTVKQYPGGQMFSGEFLLCFLLFMVSLTLLLSLWNTSTRDILRTENLLALEDMAVDATEQLVRTPGAPTDWGLENVTSLGLANESRELAPSKVKQFVEYLSENTTDSCSPGMARYECNLHMLGIAGYDVYFNISHLNGSTVVLDDVECYVGRTPVNETEKITVTRTAILNDEITRIHLTVWK